MAANRSLALRFSSGAAAVAAATALALATPLVAQAAESPVYLNTADGYAVLAALSISNTGTTVISNGDVGLSPGAMSSVTGFSPTTVVPPGTIHAADAESLQAQSDLTTAYNDAAGRSPVESGITELGGRTLTAGTYSGGTLAITGTLTLSGDASSVFVFQASSTLITAANSSVSLLGGTVNACNVFWQVGSSATLGVDSLIVGTVMADQSITATTRASVQGRLLARNGSVTLDTNTIVASKGCDAASTAATLARLNADAAAAAQAATPVPPAVTPVPPAVTGETVNTPVETTSAPELASTGFDPFSAIIGTSSLLGLGGVLVLVARRRAHRS